MKIGIFPTISQWKHKKLPDSNQSAIMNNSAKFQLHPPNIASDECIFFTNLTNQIETFGRKLFER